VNPFDFSNFDEMEKHKDELLEMMKSALPFGPNDIVIHVAEKALEMMDYSKRMYLTAWNEGVKRGLKEFEENKANENGAKVKFLSREERFVVAEDLKKLTDEELLQCLVRFETLPSCLQLTHKEIERRKLKIDGRN